VNIKIYIIKTFRVILYGREILSLISADKHGPNIYENRVPRKLLVPKTVEAKGGRRNAHHEELNVLYSLPNISTKITARGIRCAGHVARAGKKTNAFRALKGRQHVEDPRV
jgi:hypothetical protein